MTTEWIPLGASHAVHSFMLCYSDDNSMAVEPTSRLLTSSVPISLLIFVWLLNCTVSTTNNLMFCINATSDWSNSVFFVVLHAPLLFPHHHKWTLQHFLSKIIYHIFLSPYSFQLVLLQQFSLLFPNTPTFLPCRFCCCFFVIFHRTYPCLWFISLWIVYLAVSVKHSEVHLFTVLLIDNCLCSTLYL